MLLLEPSACSEKNNSTAAAQAEPSPPQSPHSSLTRPLSQTSSQPTTAEPLHVPVQSATASPPHTPAQSFTAQLPSSVLASAL